MKYAPINATKKTGKKTSCMVDFIVSMALTWSCMACKAQPGDFRRGTDPHGRPPVACAAIDVYQGIFVAIKALHIGLIQRDHKIPRHILSAMGVPAEHQVHLVGGCLENALGLVGQHNDRQ